MKLTVDQAGFDPRKPHLRHPKTGQVIAHNQFRVVVRQSSEGRGSEMSYEFPLNSGIFYRRQDSADGQMFLVIDQDASKEGLAAREKAIRDASRTAVEKARDVHSRAKAELDAAEVAHAKEQAALRPEVRSHNSHNRKES